MASNSSNLFLLHTTLECNTKRSANDALAMRQAALYLRSSFFVSLSPAQLAGYSSPGLSSSSTSATTILVLEVLGGRRVERYRRGMLHVHRTLFHCRRGIRDFAVYPYM